MSFFNRKAKLKTKGKEKENSSPSGTIQPLAPSHTASKSSPALKTSPTNSLTKPPDAKPDSIGKGGATDKSSVGSHSGAAAVSKSERTQKETERTDAVFTEEGMVSPPGHKPDKPGRKDKKNMSISKSGRHKYRIRQRSSVIEGDIFGRHNSAPDGCRDVEPATGSTRTQSLSSQPTAV